ncbi:hypothetical protein QFZ79_002059 [Arthrobacter sp. V4I6]|nr:hypothetical protein [Arthrobacter sp. V1I7]MDQ0853948.1 hypothetical protein [Arthrobacter sp. V4I6]
MIAAMIQELAGDSEAAIVRGYQRAMLGINEHHRRSATPHPHERYLPEEVLRALLKERGESLLAFLRHVKTEEFLRRNGVTEWELAAIRVLLGR